ncbi:MAG: non-canonical purine NTP pyrophosphatase [Nannocystales bacterium]
MTPSWLPASLVVATHNPGKLAEWRLLLEPLGVRVHTPSDLALAEPEETEPDYVGNAVLKAQAASRATGMAALADDTGFEADALNGGPGVLTARWAAEHGGYPAATRTLLEQAGVGTAARLICAVALVVDDRVRTAQAQVAGTLRATLDDAPGFAAMLVPEVGGPLVADGVLPHRRAAFERLLATP